MVNPPVGWPPVLWYSEKAQLTVTIIMTRVLTVTRGRLYLTDAGQARTGNSDGRR
jgi:hypothetical protein